VGIVRRPTNYNIYFHALASSALDFPTFSVAVQRSRSTILPNIGAFIHGLCEFDMDGAVGGLEAKAQFRESRITSGEKTARSPFSYNLIKEADFDRCSLQNWNAVHLDG
jgi:hypothetical protein